MLLTEKLQKLKESVSFVLCSAGCGRLLSKLVISEIRAACPWSVCVCVCYITITGTHTHMLQCRRGKHSLANRSSLSTSQRHFLLPSLSHPLLILPLLLVPVALILPPLLPSCLRPASWFFNTPSITACLQSAVSCWWHRRVFVLLLVAQQKSDVNNQKKEKNPPRLLTFALNVYINSSSPLDLCNVHHCMCATTLFRYINR